MRPSPASRHLDLGPDHPTRPGLVEIVAHHDGQRLTRAHLEIGHLHRGAEKLFEVRDLRQIPVLASRHDWQAPFIGELGACVVIEKALGLETPPRATWLRTGLCEFSRAMSHLAFLSWLPHRSGDSPLSQRIHNLLDGGHLLWQRLTGHRVHPMTCRVGGIDCFPDDRWWDDLTDWFGGVATTGEDLAATLASPRMAELTVGTAVIDAEMVDTHGLTGPVARASGVDVDLRRGHHLAHDQLAFPPDPPLPAAPSGPTSGDAAARLWHLIADLAVSADLVAQVRRGLPELEGPLAARLPSVVKAPRGITWSALEAPWGQAGYLLVSRGERVPWRLALRTPTFANVQALEAVLPGTELDRLDAAIASLGWTLGDLDK